MPQASSPNRTIYLAFALIALAAFGRILSHLLPALGNFTPVFAVALFGGAVFKDRKLALLLPMIAMLITDLIIGLHSLMWLVYGCMALTTWLGMRLQNRMSSSGVLLSALLSSILFFVLSNVFVWLEGQLYPLTFNGLRDCFVAAIPFWRNELFGTLLWSAALFGAFALLKDRRLALA